MKYSLENFKKNETLETENVSLKSDNATLLARAKELESKLAEADKTMAAFPLASQEWESKYKTQEAEHANAVESLQKENDEKVNALTQALEATKTSLSKEVVASLKSVGIEAGTIKEEISAPLTPAQAFEKFNSLTGAERSEYYKEHKALILQAAR